MLGKPRYQLFINPKWKECTKLLTEPPVRLMDYENRVETNVLTGWQNPISLEKSDVLQFITEDGSKISARPSGTEPKIKFYVSVNEPLPRKEDFDGVMQKLQDKVQGIGLA
jgi:phosphoglucomutase